ncbi:carboxypeptidase-like regulatory domain-containing protein [Singulisphaera sp. Ch08]|uniref:Carboxypeptidase-like regulatory domain-containing protein n=1 Tax=Singulisphaera sp. Ch08 TaxID=3120278 RepID=A0AAU7CID7_9BACT
MLIGYVSDEQYSALPDVLLEFVKEGESWEARSRASGAVHGDIPPGNYLVTVAKPGFGSKRIALSFPRSKPYQFRLLSDALLGYAWPKSVRGGMSGEFRVHSTEPYQLELWRYGLEKEHVLSLGWHDEHAPRSVVQTIPDGDFTQVGAGWNGVGYQSAHHWQKVVAPDRSGLYYFHASTPSGQSFTFPWVVAPSRPRSPIAVLASDITWNSYNSFGGRSNYIHADALPTTPTVCSRTELARYLDEEYLGWNCRSYAPLSFDRPEPFNHVDLKTRVTDPISGRAACHLAPAEWRLLGWLEREKFAHDLYSETQLHHGEVDLSAYRVLILGAHPEYWTRTMYDRVKSWVFNEGGQLMYLGGNGLNCEVELRDDQTMVANNGQIRSLWPAGIGAESRFAVRHESEARLLGVVFDPAGIMTAAPYRVISADHWVFAGTGLGEGDLFGVNSLHERCPGGASGHETDKISPNSPSNVKLLAKGLNPDEGGAEMAIFETPSGGSVFSVGSITYISSLLCDSGVSQVTANVVRRFLE